MEIVKELQKIKRAHSQGDEQHREVHSQENVNKRAGKRPCLEAEPSSEKKGNSTIVSTSFYGQED